MTCPRCGAITELLPCPVCGWEPEDTPPERPRPKQKPWRRLILLLGLLLVAGLALFGLSRVLFSGDWQEPAAPTGPTLEEPAPAPEPRPGDPVPAPEPEPAPAPEPEPEPVPPRFTVVVDPGHGGSKQPGVAVGETCEKEVNLLVAFKLKALLEADNIQVVMTRTEDVYMDLDDRIDLANDIKADAFLSIHCNSFENEKVRGFEVFYYKSEIGKAMAEVIRQAAETLGILTRECKSGNYQVLRDAKLPAALAEIGYFSSPEELELLRQDSYQDKIAQALHDGLLAYLEQEPEA